MSIERVCDVVSLSFFQRGGDKCLSQPRHESQFKEMAFGFFFTFLLFSVIKLVM